MKKLVYTPFSIVFGMLGARIGKKAFNTIWGRVSDEPKPSAKEPEVSLGRIAASAALEGATLAAATAVARQLSVRAFHHVFGVWPVKPKRKTADDAV
ncbi:MAG TPA: DUF4235 domain-containing protein [Solirubrobacteraceae bacterium]|nr:DUF4235 domain-containing protein [Solirubrobacteraceae bacterium]